MGRLTFVGLGLAPGDLTESARQAIAEADEVIAEFYTSRLAMKTPDEISRWLGREVRFVRRCDVEDESDRILEAARAGTVCFVAAGDAMTATTHGELRVRAHKAGIPTRVVHGVSIHTAAASEVGLHSYKFGRTTTLVTKRGAYLPESPFEVILENRRRGLHSLVLLDIDVEEERFMFVPEAAGQIIEVATRRDQDLVTPKTLAVGCARIGTATQTILTAPLDQLAKADLGGPLHCLIVPGDLHFTEEEALDLWRTA